MQPSIQQNGNRDSRQIAHVDKTYSRSAQGRGETVRRLDIGRKRKQVLHEVAGPQMKIVQSSRLNRFFCLTMPAPDEGVRSGVRDFC